MIYHPIKSSRKFKVFRYSQKSLKISPSTLFSIPLPCECCPVLARQSKTNSNYSFTKVELTSRSGKLVLNREPYYGSDTQLKNQEQKKQEAQVHKDWFSVINCMPTMFNLLYKKRSADNKRVVKIMYV